MNSSTSDAMWPTPGAAHELSLHVNVETQITLIADIAADIIGAAQDSDFSCSVDVSAQLSQDVQYAMALLNQAGYTTQVTGTNLVVSW